VRKALNIKVIAVIVLYGVPVHKNAICCKVQYRCHEYMDMEGIVSLYSDLLACPVSAKAGGSGRIEPQALSDYENR
jgi:hypothetical protein